MHTWVLLFRHKNACATAAPPLCHCRPAGGPGCVAARRQGVHLLEQHVGRHLARGAGQQPGTAQCRWVRLGGGPGLDVRWLVKRSCLCCLVLTPTLHVRPVLLYCRTSAFCCRVWPGQLHGSLPGCGLAGPEELEVQQAVSGGGLGGLGCQHLACTVLPCTHPAHHSQKPAP